MRIVRAITTWIIPVVLSVAAAPNQALSLPEAISTLLSAAYPGWRFATLDEQHYRELSGELRSRRSPEWICRPF